MTLRRLKTYTAQTGYVYQYYFVGKRDALPEASPVPATEFIFDVSSDRKLTYSVSVFLPRDAVQAWSARHGRPITDAEQYASAKMRLLRAFDEVENMLAEGRQLTVTSDLLEELLAELGVDQ
jgi:hypothetical protein